MEDISKSFDMIINCNSFLKPSNLRILHLIIYIWSFCKNKNTYSNTADKVYTMCQVKSWIMCTSQHSQFIQVAVSSIRSIKEDYHLAFQVWMTCLKFPFSAKQQLLDKNQEVAKNVITVPNSVQNYCKTSQEPAAVLCLMTVTKNG